MLALRANMKQAPSYGPRILYRLLHFLHRHDSALSRWLVHWLKRLLPAPPSPVTVPSSFGFHFQVEPGKDHPVDGAIYACGATEPGTFAVLEHLLRPDDVFVDIGAYKGFYTLFAANKIGAGGKIYAFEAHPSAAQRLHHNLQLNQLEGIQVFPIALGSRDGEGLLYPHAQFSRSSLLGQHINGTSGIPVSIRRLDSILVPYTDIHVMKVDVEGWEMEVLNGAFPFLVKEDAPALIIEHCEMQSPNLSLFNLYEFLTTINHYRLFRLKRGKERISPLVPIRREEELPKGDKVFCLLENHLKRLPRRLFERLN